MTCRTLAAVVTAASITGCGGGGGASTVAQSPQYDYTLGAASSDTAARSRIAEIINVTADYVAPDDGTTYDSINDANVALNSGGDPIATTDTGAAAAWSAGWTGKGVNVWQLGTFNSNGLVDTEGDYQSIVLGSIAPEINRTWRDWSSYTNPLSEFGIEMIDNGADIALLEGYYSYDTGTTADSNDLATFVSAYSPAATGNNFEQTSVLAVIASGFTGSCSSNTVTVCNGIAAQMDALRSEGKATSPAVMIVGELNDAGTDIEVNSLRAGDNVQDFILAHNDVLTSGDGDASGYSAARVAGAGALLKHKFPNLNGAAIKQILLQTATDMGVAGPDATYGYGSLNLTNALSPQGKVVPK